VEARRQHAAVPHVVWQQCLLTCSHAGALDAQVKGVLVNQVTYTPAAMPPLVLNNKVVDGERLDAVYDMLSYVVRPWVSLFGRSGAGYPH
jgi:hypothetical protein